MAGSIKLDKIELGTCYYPEHWSEDMWQQDLKRMLEAGIETIRIGEFAWSRIEPTEAVFTFDFFDRFLDLAHETGMKVIFGTPTATPPAWLTSRYPEVLNGDKDGHLYRHGARRHYNYNSIKYRELSARIVTKIGEHYGHHPAIIGWQIDNEINCEMDEFYSESDETAFRRFLIEKYGSLEILNAAWGAVFWNQEYTDWEQVKLPEKTTSGTVNPHRVLDYLRFISASARSYVKMQSEILKTLVSSEAYVTTNGLFGNLDSHAMTEESLDFLTYDSYPNFAYCLREDPRQSNDFNDRKWSKKLAEMRSISPNFGIMEQQSGANGWNSMMEAPAPKPGQMTLWTMQSIAHGADFISYFRWRTATMGTEIYWHGILDYSGRDNRRLAEVKQISLILQNLKEIAGAENTADFAVLRDYDNIWDAQVDVWHSRFESASQKGIFQAAQLLHVPMDYYYFGDQTKAEDLKKYPVLFYPHAVILTKERTEILEEYVREGNTLVLGCRTGYKDVNGKCRMDYLPGFARAMSGADVIDSTFVGPDDDAVSISWNGELMNAAVYNDILKPLDDAKVIGTYDSNYYQGEPGLTCKKYGKGTIYYFGAAFDQQAASVFLKNLGLEEPYKEWLSLPKECELQIRTNGEKTWYFILNYAKYPVKMTAVKEMYELTTSRRYKGITELEPYGVRVFEG